MLLQTILKQSDKLRHPQLNRNYLHKNKNIKLKDKIKQKYNKYNNKLILQNSLYSHYSILKIQNNF